MSCCDVRDGGVSGGSGGAAAGAPVAEYSLDFRDQTAGALGTATHTYEGLDWQAVTAAGDTFEIDASGLQFASEGSTATQYSSTTLTASHLEVELADLYSFLEIDARHKIECFLYLSALATVGSGQLVVLILRGDSGSPANYSARAAGAERGQINTAQVIGSWKDTGTDTNTNPFPDIDTMGIVSDPGNGVGAIFGEWDTDFDTTKFLMHTPVDSQPSNQSQRTVQNKLGFGFFGTSGGVWTATVQQLLIRAYA